MKGEAQLEALISKLEHSSLLILELKSNVFKKEISGKLEQNKARIERGPKIQGLNGLLELMKKNLSFLDLGFIPLSDYHLGKLHDSINIQSITQLILDHCNLAEIPSSFLVCKNIVKLVLCCNRYFPAKFFLRYF